MFCFIGSNRSNKNDFERTTLANLGSDNAMLWVHICVSFFSFPLSILMMRRFSANLNFVKTSIEISKTLMVENIDRKILGSQDALREYFTVIYFPWRTTDSLSQKLSYSNISFSHYVIYKLNDGRLPLRVASPQIFDLLIMWKHLKRFTLLFEKRKVHLATVSKRQRAIQINILMYTQNHVAGFVPVSAVASTIDKMGYHFTKVRWRNWK